MTRRQKRENDWEDDGRTIVNMNVEGMPGYIRTFDEQASAPDPAHKREMVSPHETRMIILASMKWAFLYSMGDFAAHRAVHPVLRQGLAGLAAQNIRHTPCAGANPAHGFSIEHFFNLPARM